MSFLNKPIFTCVQKKTYENTVRKGKIARKRAISPFPTVFCTLLYTVCHFYQILNIHLQTVSVWNTLKFVDWKRVNHLPVDKIFASSKLKAYVDDDKRNVDKTLTLSSIVWITLWENEKW